MINEFLSAILYSSYSLSFSCYGTHYIQFSYFIQHFSESNWNCSLFILSFRIIFSHKFMRNSNSILLILRTLNRVKEFHQNNGSDGWQRALIYKNLECFLYEIRTWFITKYLSCILELNSIFLIYRSLYTTHRDISIFCWLGILNCE